jgi:uncharacterized protein
VTKAVEWYAKSTEQDNSVAMNNLGYCYHLGIGVDEDKTKAFELYMYEQSALLGNSAAMFNVGVCYEDGEGVTIDMNKAKEWYTKATAQGNTNAQTQLDLLDE